MSKDQLLDMPHAQINEALSTPSRKAQLLEVVTEIVIKGTRASLSSRSSPDMWSGQIRSNVREIGLQVRMEYSFSQAAIRGTSD